MKKYEWLIRFAVVTVLVLVTLALAGCAEYGASVTQESEQTIERAVDTERFADPDAPEDAVTWARFLDGPAEDVEARKLRHREDGGYVILAASEQTVYVVETGSTGEMESQRELSVPDLGEAMDDRAGDGFVLAGKSAVGAEQENSQAYLVKLSPDSAV